MNNIISLESGRVRTTTRQDRKQTNLSLSIKKEKNLEIRACYFFFRSTCLHMLASHAWNVRDTHAISVATHFSIAKNNASMKILPARNVIMRHDAMFFYTNVIYTFWFLLSLSPSLSLSSKIIYQKVFSFSPLIAQSHVHFSLSTSESIFR